MYLYARFLGYKGSITDCDTWSKKEFKKRNFSTILEIEIDSMQVDISKLREAIDLGVVNRTWELLAYLCFRKNYEPT